MLTVNEGALDRVLRITVGLILLSLWAFGPQSLLGLIGIVPLVTGLVGVCPLYSLLGIRTCPVQPGKK